MLLKKEGFPEENELVLCTVTAIHFHSVFVTLDEYGKQGMVHISEVSPGRIRNLRDFVKEGKKIVCKVLRIDREKGHIDLSLRRVNDMQRKEKASQLKQEQLAENILGFLAKQRNEDPKIIYAKVTKNVFEHYDSLFALFDDVAAGRANLEELGIEPELARQLADVIRQRIKPAEVEIKGELKITSYEPDGVELIKAAVKGAGEGAEITYKGGGVYSVKVKSTDYKDAEKSLGKFVDSVVGFMNSHRSHAEFKRIET